MPVPVKCTCGAVYQAPDRLAGRRIKCRQCLGPVPVPKRRKSSDRKHRRIREAVEDEDSDIYDIQRPPEPRMAPTPLKRIRFHGASDSADRHSSAQSQSRLDDGDDYEPEENDNEEDDDEMSSFTLGILNILAAGGLWVFFTWLESGGRGPVPLVLIAIYAWAGKNVVCGAWAALGAFVFLTGFLPQTDDQK